MPSYDTMSAYMQAENKKMAETDKAVQKQVADAALGQITADRTAINQNYDNAVKAAYIQRDRANKGLKSETSQIANRANTENLIRGLNTQRGYDNTNLDLQNQKVNANLTGINADIDTIYTRPDVEYELRMQQDAENRALEQAQIEKAEREEAQAGLMERLNELAVQSGYDYDFDADIFALKQQGYTSDDWQIQYLQEAKRLQSRAAKALKKQSIIDEDVKSPIDEGDGGSIVGVNKPFKPITVFSPETGNPLTVIDNPLDVLRHYNTVRQTNAMNAANDKRADALAEWELTGLPVLAQMQVRESAAQYENGEITANQFKEILAQNGAYIDSAGRIRSN